MICGGTKANSQIAFTKIKIPKNLKFSLKKKKKISLFDFVQVVMNMLASRKSC